MIRLDIRVGDLVVSRFGGDVALYDADKWTRCGHLYAGEVALVVAVFDGAIFTEIIVLTPSCCGSRAMERFECIRTTG